jgi:predicted GNAT family N-acyltransferase
MRQRVVAKYNAVMKLRDPEQRPSRRSVPPSSSCLIRIADYAADESTLRTIRFAVFVDEQGVPPDIEMDERDACCVHLLAFLDGEPVATARIDLEQAGKIGRLAVRAHCRRQGIGRALMARCHEIARANGLDSVWCNAQVAAVAFYESLGYRGAGALFDEAGIEHRRMTKTLAHRVPAEPSA